MDCLPRLNARGLVALPRRVVRGVPQVVESPARLDAVGREPRERVVRVDAPYVSPGSDERAAGVLPGRCDDVEIEPLEELPDSEHDRGCLPDQSTEGEIPDTRRARAAEGSRQVRVHDRNEELDTPVAPENLERWHVAHERGRCEGNEGVRTGYCGTRGIRETRSVEHAQRLAHKEAGPAGAVHEARPP